MNPAQFFALICKFRPEIDSGAFRQKGPRRIFNQCSLYFYPSNSIQIFLVTAE